MMNLVSSLKSDSSKQLINESPLVHLSVFPNAGHSTENIEVRCEITPPSLISPLALSKFDNIYLSVKTDSVRPSGILLKFDDSTDRCTEISGKKFQVDVCNATLIVIRINHSIVNDTLQKIDYVCSKGTTYVQSSYKIISKKNILFSNDSIDVYLEDHSARYYDPMYNSSLSLTHTYLFVLFIAALITSIQWL